MTSIFKPVGISPSVTLNPSMGRVYDQPELIGSQLPIDEPDEYISDPFAAIDSGTIDVGPALYVVDYIVDGFWEIVNSIRGLYYSRTRSLNELSRLAANDKTGKAAIVAAMILSRNNPVEVEENLRRINVTGDEKEQKGAGILYAHLSAKDIIEPLDKKVDRLKGMASDDNTTALSEIIKLARSDHHALFVLIELANEATAEGIRKIATGAVANFDISEWVTIAQTELNGIHALGYLKKAGHNGAKEALRTIKGDTSKLPPVAFFILKDNGNIHALEALRTYDTTPLFNGLGRNFDGLETLIGLAGLGNVSARQGLIGYDVTRFVEELKRAQNDAYGIALMWLMQIARLGNTGARQAVEKIRQDAEKVRPRRIPASLLGDMEN